jgi:hypothetical protein
MVPEVEMPMTAPKVVRTMCHELSSNILRNVG